MSLRFVVDDVGVPCVELAGERLVSEANVPVDDEAAAGVESFFLEDLLESFDLESCSC